jgi:hypothetical protein
VAARVQADKGKADGARHPDLGAMEHAADDEARTVARLRLAGLLDAGKGQEALATLAMPRHPASRRWWPTAAPTCWPPASGARTRPWPPTRSAWKDMPPTVEYRRLVEAEDGGAGCSAPASGAAK